MSLEQAIRRRACEPTLAGALLPSCQSTSQRTLDQLLRAVRTHLGMDVAFASEFVDTLVVMRHVDALAKDGPIQVGNSFPLEDGYCKRIVDGTLPQLMPDTSAVPVAAALPVTTTIPVGAHLSVPIRLRDGRIFGTFCCFSFEPDLSLNDRDLRTMRAFADIAAELIDQQRGVDSARKAKSDRVQAVLEQKLFSIVYQPIFGLSDNRVAGMECLVRFPTEPDRGPHEWFAEAAEVGLGVDLEVATMRAALSALPHVPSEIYLAVNASPATVSSGKLEQALADLPLERVVLEITEHADIDDYSSVAAALTSLRQHGLRLAIDDVGAGYSSLRHILDLTPEIIKLDISLIRGIDRDLARQALSAAFTEFARRTGSQIVAEGVETSAELQVLRATGVNNAQGYFLGGPASLDEVVSSLC